MYFRFLNVAKQGFDDIREWCYYILIFCYFHIYIANLRYIILKFYEENKMTNNIPYNIQQTEKYNQKTQNILNELPDYCTAFVNYKYYTMEPRSRCSYVQDLRIFFHFLKENNPTVKNTEIKDIPLDLLDQLDQDDIVEYLKWLGSYSIDGKYYRNGNVGLKRKLASLRTFYKYISSQKGMITNNPAIKVELPKLNKPNIRTLEDWEREDFLELFEYKYQEALEKIENTAQEKLLLQDKAAPAIIKRNKAIFYVLIGTGLRVSELVGIDLRDIKEETGRVNIVRKGGNHDYVLLSEEVIDVLYEYIHEFRSMLARKDCQTDALFISQKKTRLTVRSIERMISSYADEAFGANHGLTPHKLRATYGTQYYSQTGDIAATADVLGNTVAVARKHYVNQSAFSKEKMRSMKVKL